MKPILCQLRYHSYVYPDIAIAQANAGMFEEVFASLQKITAANERDRAFCGIAYAQSKAGDFRGAQKTTDPIVDLGERMKAKMENVDSHLLQESIAASSRGTGGASNSTKQINPAISDWLSAIADPLSKAPFSDITESLAAMGRHSDAQETFSELRRYATAIVEAQVTIDKMLRQQSK